MNLPTQAFAEVLNSLRQPQSGSGVEKRRATRMQLESAVKVTIQLPGQPQRDFRMLTRDISHSGIGLFSSVPLRCNERLIIHLPRAHRPTIYVLIEVKVTRPLADGIHALGCEFVEVVANPDSLRSPGDEIQRIQQSILL